MDVQVVHTRVFAATRKGGNPCPVIPFADALTPLQMQAVARRFGLDTVFLLKPRSPDSDVFLRFFVPDHEMGISGHATIAAVIVGLHSKLLKGHQWRIDTISGVFDVTSAVSRGEIAVTLAQNRPTFGPIVAPDEVLNALKIRRDDLLPTEWPIQSVSVSRAKLLVPLSNHRVLECLRPDFEAVWRYCEKVNVTGFYPFTPRTNKRGADLEARQFPLRAGFAEDAATGVAAAALGAYVTLHRSIRSNGRHRFRIAQGHAMGSPSRIDVITECMGGAITAVSIQGAAQVLGRERVLLGL